MKIQNITDGYKVYHFQQYHDQIKTMYGNLTARGDKYFNRVMKGSNPLNNTYVAFGMQQAIKEIVNKFDEDFFNKPKHDVLNDFARTIGSYIGYEQGLDEKMSDLHDYGRLPITVKTVNEGDFVNMNDPAMIVETDEGFAWVFGYLEPIITNMVWKSITNATTAFEFFKIAKIYGDKTGTNDVAIKFGFHDFSSRGMSGMEDSSRNGVPHLLFFNGTESVGAIGYIEEMYDYNYATEGMIAGSIKATEHSVSTSNIFFNMNEDDSLDLTSAEEKFFKKYITEIYPSGLVGYVADSFDFYKFVYEILPKYKDDIEARDGKVVIRPDSFDDPIEGVLGDTETPFFLTMGEMQHEFDVNPEFVNWMMQDDAVVRVFDEYVCVDKDDYGNFIGFMTEKATPEETGTLPKLLKEFGYTINDAGYAELNPKIGIIYGDGFSLERTKRMFGLMEEMGIATSNIVVGLGASMAYGWVSRDTLGIAYKATSFSTVKDGKRVDVDVFKDPKGAKKTSAKGRFVAIKENGLWKMRDGASVEESETEDMMITLFKDGILNEVTFSEIRNNISKNIETVGFENI